MAVGRSKGSPVEGQKSLLKKNGAEDDVEDDDWHVAYNKPSATGVVENGDRKRHSSNVSAAQKSVQSKIEDLELDDAGFVDLPPRIRGGTNRKAFLAIIVGVIVGVAAIVSVVVFYFRSSYIPNNYIIVVDAGSSHTKLNVFHYRGDKINGTGKIEQLEFRECNGTLQSFKKDLESLRKAWIPCLKFGRDLVPEERWEKTEVYVGGTAGMRQLKKSNPAEAEALLAEVRAVLNETYSLSEERIHVVILEGEEEGALSWATVNFVTKNLLPDNITLLEHSQKTYGALDLGGASAQISFSTNDEKIANFKLNFFGIKYQLFSKSFSCRGKKEAHNFLRAQLVSEKNSNDFLAKNKNDFSEKKSNFSEKNKKNSEKNKNFSEKNSQFFAEKIEHPCYPFGSLTVENHTDLFSSSCTKNLEKNLFFRQKQYQFFGTGNFSQCRKIVRNLFNETTCRGIDLDCSFSSQLKALNISGPFMGFAGFFFVMDFFNMTNHDDPAGSKLLVKPTDFRKAYTQHCGLPWQSERMRNSTNKFIKGYCFDGIFIDILLHDVYGFSDEEFERIEFRRAVDGVSTGWAVGLALNSTNAIPPENELEMMSRTFFLIFLVIFAVFLVLAISFLCRGVRRSCRDNSI